VQVFEAQAQAGGRARSYSAECEGETFVIDRGPLGWVGPAPEIEGAASVLGLEIIESDAADSHRYLADRGDLVPIPQDAKKLAGFSVFSVRERMRAAAEKWADFADETVEETVFELVTRRYGEGFATKLAVPLVRALWGDNARAVSARELLPCLQRAELQHGSLTKALHESPSVFGQKTMSFRGGIGSLCTAMADRLGGSLQLNQPIDGAIRESGWWYLYRDNQCVGVGQQLAVCLPPAQAALVLREVIPSADLQFGRFQGSDLATVSLLYRKDEVRDACAGHGIIAPADGQNPVANVEFVHSIFPQHLADDWLHLRGVLCADVDPLLLQRSDDELSGILEASLRQWVGTPDRGARASFVHRVPGGVPHFGIGRSAHLAELANGLAAVPGLHLGGDACFGIGVETALQRGSAIALAARELPTASQ